MDLSHAVAFVTGADRGLGAAFVEGLLARGARVHAAALDVAWLAPAVARHGDRVVPVALDVTDPQAIAAAARAAPDVTVLVNNAGVLAQLGLVEAGSIDPLRAEMEVNVLGLAAMSLAFAPVIARNGGGAIVNMLSTASLLPFPAFGSYAATKAAAMSLTHSMRHELAPRGVRVVGVYAGFIDTGMVATIDVGKASPQAVVERALAGLEAGINDIDGDDRSAQARGRLHDGLDAVLDDLYSSAERFRAAHPARKPD